MLCRVVNIPTFERIVVHSEGREVVETHSRGSVLRDACESYSADEVTTSPRNVRVVTNQRGVTFQKTRPFNTSVGTQISQVD
jgi:hypothetical protein